jgi:hypothetical protein
MHTLKRIYSGYGTNKRNLSSLTSTPLFNTCTVAVCTLLLTLFIAFNTSNANARSFRHFQEIPVAPSSQLKRQNPSLQTVIAQVNAGDDLENILLGDQLNQQQANAQTLMLGSHPNATSVAALLNARPKPDRQRVQQALEQVLTAWNSGGLQHYLATDFYDGQRLTDNLAQRIPQDAKLKLMQLEGFQIIKDEVVSTQNQEQARAWLTSVDAVTQIEFNDPLAGFVQLRGKQRFTLRLFDFAERQLALQ